MKLLLAFSWGALVVAACGSDDDDGREDTDAAADSADTADADTGDPPLVRICHRTEGGDAEAVTLTLAEAAEHFAHGDPVGLLADVIHVDADAAAAAPLGTALAPLPRIGDALALARCGHGATGTRHTIDVAPGTYRVSYEAESLLADPALDAAPLIIDFPLHLRGHTVVATNPHGTPEGTGYDAYLDPADNTIVAPDRPLDGSEELLVYIADTDGVRLEGVVFRSGHCRSAAHCPGEATVDTRGGAAVIAVRSSALELAGLVAFPGFESAFEARGSTVELSGSVASDTQICVVCMNDDGRYDIHHNWLENGLGGIFIGGSLGPFAVALGTQAEAFPIPDYTGASLSHVETTIHDNVLIGHTRNGTAFGVRVIAFGRGAAGLVEEVDVSARVLDNIIALPTGAYGAVNGILLDGGFTTRGAGPLSATVSLEATGNIIYAERAQLVIVTARAQAVTTNVDVWGASTVVHAGSFTVETDIPVPAEIWVDHFAADPLSGATTAGGECAANLDCSSAVYRGAALPGVCAMGTCACPAGFTADADSVCHDSTPTSFTVVIDGESIPPGTAIP